MDRIAFLAPTGPNCRRQMGGVNGRRWFIAELSREFASDKQEDPDYSGLLYFNEAGDSVSRDAAPHPDEDKGQRRERRYGKPQDER